MLKGTQLLLCSTLFWIFSVESEGSKFCGIALGFDLNRFRLTELRINILKKKYLLYHDWCCGSM